MKIAQIAPFEESIPPKKYGGTELVVYNLTEELVRRGHEVFLFASGDSKTSARLFPVFPRALRKTKIGSDLKTREAYKLIGIAEILSVLLKERFDIIHNHIGWRLLSFAEILQDKIVTTLHGPLNIGYQRTIYKKFRDLPYISISKNQRTPLPELNFVANVYNGIDLKKFLFNDRPKDYLAFLGRMSPEKGPVEAIKIAKKAKMKLIMAAKVDLVDIEYFSKQVKPLIDGKQIKFIGEVDHKRKSELLKKAKALIAPIQWPEPFGLFFVEAMACGTPVIAFRRGSAPEIVRNGETGFVVKNIDSAVKAVKKIREIDRKKCRQWVEENFSTSRMVDNYERVYYQIGKK
jgi:glycosyltransferase involved in cell wall biosynthesis